MRISGWSSDVCSSDPRSGARRSRSQPCPGGCRATHAGRCVYPSGFAARPPHGDTTMSDTPPDRLSSDPRSRFHDAAALERGLAVRSNGDEPTNVEAYSPSEGGVRLPLGQPLDRPATPMPATAQPTAQPSPTDPPPPPPPPSLPPPPPPPP